MALTVATHVAVLTRRGHSTMGLVQSRDEADNWMEDAIHYRAAGAIDRAIVAIPDLELQDTGPHGSCRTRRVNRTV